MRGEAFDYARELADGIGELDAVDIAVCPPFTAIDVVADVLGALGVGVWGQTMHEAEQGAFTGEISAGMLADAGANGVLLGHSSAGAFGETDAALARKVPAALAAGLDPVLCVGETEQERDAGATVERLRAQLAGALDELDAARALQVTHRLRAGLGDRHRAHRDARAGAGGARRACAPGSPSAFGPDVAETVRILYGGSRQARERARAARGPRRGRRARRRREPVGCEPARDRARRAAGSMTPAPVALVILDGFGCRAAGPGQRGLARAACRCSTQLWQTMPHTMLAASGLDVGLPEGQMGNSEVGHLNLGAGRVVPQTLVRIGCAVADGSLASNPAFVAACDAACAGRGVLHLAGLVSDGGVHSHVDHLRALVRAATVRGVPRVAVHAFTDGRDVSPHQAADLLEQLARSGARPRPASRR